MSDLAEAEKWKEILDQVVRFMNNEESMSSTKSTALASYTSYLNDIDHSNQTFGEDLEESDFLQSFRNIWKKKTYVETQLGNNEYFRYNFSRMVEILWNVSDHSKHLCDWLVKCGFLTKDLIPRLDVPRHEVPKILQLLVFLLQGSLGLLHNCLRHTPEAVPHLIETNVVRSLEQLADRLEKDEDLNQKTTEELQARVFICVAFLLPDEDIEDDSFTNLQVTTEVVYCLFDVLRTAMEEDDHRSKVYGFTAVEILEALDRLAMGEKNRNLMLENSAAALIGNFLKPDCSDKEHRMAATILWRMALVDEGKAILAELTSVTDLLRALASPTSCSHKDTKKICQGALWVVHGMPRAKKTSAHIMLSYATSTRKTVLDLRKKLEHDKYNTWMDVDDMEADVVDDMAYAVENASVVIMLVGSDYEKSTNCESEAKYAHQLGKQQLFIKLEPKFKPAGYLSFMLGTKKYFDLSKRNLEDEYKNIKKQLNIQIGVWEAKQAMKSGASSMPCQPHVIVQSQSEDNLRARFPELFQRLPWLSVSRLKSLARLYETVPQTFFARVDQNLVDLPQLLDLISCFTETS